MVVASLTEMWFRYKMSKHHCRLASWQSFSARDHATILTRSGDRELIVYQGGGKLGLDSRFQSLHLRGGSCNNPLDICTCVRHMYKMSPSEYKKPHKSMIRSRMGGLDITTQLETERDI